MDTINLFFTRKGGYECIVTTKDEIDTPYDRKITVELVKAKPWAAANLVGVHGVMTAPERALSESNDDKYFFIDSRGWIMNYETESYLALAKRLTDGEEYYTHNLLESINGSSCNLFLFPV